MARESLERIARFWESGTFRFIAALVVAAAAAERWRGTLVTTLDLSAYKGEVKAEMDKRQAEAFHAEAVATQALELAKLRELEDREREIVRFAARDPQEAISTYETLLSQGVSPAEAANRALKPPRR